MSIYSFLFAFCSTCSCLLSVILDSLLNRSNLNSTTEPHNHSHQSTKGGQQRPSSMLAVVDTV